MLVGELIVLAIFIVDRHRRARPGQGPRLRASPRSTTPTRSPGRWSSARCRSRCCRSSASTASPCWPRRTRASPRGRSAAPMVAALLLAGVLFIVQTWVAALLVPDPATLIAKGDPGGTAFYDAAAVAGGAWLATLTAVATAIAWGFANSLVAQAATSRLLYAMARDRQLPSFLAKVHPHARACRSTPRSLVAAVSLALGLYMNTRDDGITLLSHAGQLRRDDRLPGAARLGGRALRRPQRQPRLAARTCRPRSIGFADPGLRGHQRQRRGAGARLRLAGHRRGRSWSSCYATGRRPDLAGADAEESTSDRRRPSTGPHPTSWPTPSAGGRAGRRRVTPGTVLELSTEDCFGGKVRGVDDLPSRGLRVPLPQPGHRAVPRRGRRARRHARRALRLDRAGPRLGRVHDVPALRRADRARTPRRRCSRRWRSGSGCTSVDRAARRVPVPGPRTATTRSTCRWTRCTARSASRPAAVRGAHRRITPDAHGGNMDTPELRAGVTVLPRRQRRRRRCSPSATGTPARARARSAASAVEAAMDTVVIVDLIKGVADAVAAAGDRRLT